MNSGSEEMLKIFGLQICPETSHELNNEVFELHLAMAMFEDVGRQDQIFDARSFTDQESLSAVTYRGKHAVLDLD